MPVLLPLAPRLLSSLIPVQPDGLSPLWRSPSRRIRRKEGQMKRMFEQKGRGNPAFPISGKQAPRG